ncbi:MAG: RluA family pseudouridine synthase [Alphaproteobacteria bacterium]|nr:RluA family pseudouridine synthase [Alphaproteobacteria bacterium]
MNLSRPENPVVTDDESGIRLDRWFKRHFADLTHGQLQKLLRTGQVRVDGKRAEASTRLESGQTIRIPPQVTLPPPKGQQQKQESRISAQLKKLILHDDKDVIVLNKPAGLAVQGGTGLKENLDDMLASLSEKGQGKPKLVHRLDRDTSGVLLVARSAYAATKLTAAFRHRDTQKIYWAVTLGVPKPERGRIDAPLIKRGELMAIDEKDREDAKSAVTFYQVMAKAGKQAAFVALLPVTGRTHQLRVHMAHIGTPILGDRMYGGDKASALPVDEFGKGLHLHARQLIIPHPRHGLIDAAAPLGPDMKKTWSWFGFDEDAEADFTDAF